MQAQTEYSTEPLKNVKSVTNRGRGEVIGHARYIQQLQQMNNTARRNNWARVVFALSALIARRRGME